MQSAWRAGAVHSAVELSETLRKVSWRNMHLVGKSWKMAARFLGQENSFRWRPTGGLWLLPWAEVWKVKGNNLEMKLGKAGWTTSWVSKSRSLDFILYVMGSYRWFGKGRDRGQNMGDRCLTEGERKWRPPLLQDGTKPLTGADRWRGVVGETRTEPESVSRRKCASAPLLLVVVKHKCRLRVARFDF